jgi:hypothetical protein
MHPQSRNYLTTAAHSVIGITRSPSDVVWRSDPGIVSRTFSLSIILIRGERGSHAAFAYPSLGQPDELVIFHH